MKKFMKTFKDTFKNMFQGPTGKLMMYLLIFVGLIILIFIFIGIASLFKGNRYSYAEVEEKMKNAAISYYEDRQDKLPTIEGGKVTVEVSSLVETKNLKSLDKITKKGVTCTGSVTVQKNGEYYLYRPNLDCGEDYKTVGLTEQIKKDNPITSENDGLYEIGENLVFRGEKVNNYVSFSGKLWRIIRINNDGSLRLLEDDIVYTGVWDDRYNIDKESSTGINNFDKSRLKDGLDKIYNEMNDVFNEKTKSQIVFKNLCIGKRYIEETDNSGNVECSTVTEPRPIGLMQSNEFMVASLDPNCTYSTDAQCSNYNYLADYTKSTWTLNADAANTHRAYKFSGGYVSSMASNESGFRLVINLSDNINYTKGNGTLENPYVVE